MPIVKVKCSSSQSNRVIKFRLDSKGKQRDQCRNRNCAKDPVTGGEVHDCKVAPEFIAQLPSADYTIAGNKYDNEEPREIIRKKSSIPIIPRKSSTIGIMIWIRAYTNTDTW